DESHPRESIDRAAARGARWFIRQQAESGAWMVIYPPNAAPADGTRVWRLDTPESRDCIFTTMLAYEALGDPQQRRATERAIDLLPKPRIHPPADIGAGLWQGAYTGNAIAMEDLPGFPASIDTLASRYSMQTLLGAWVILGDGQRLAAAETASQSLADLIKQEDNLWHRRFTFKGASLDPPPQKPQFIGEPSPASPDDPLLSLTSQTIPAARELSRKKFPEPLAPNFAPKQLPPQTIAGLSQSPMSPNFPTTQDQAQIYLKQHQPQFQLMQTLP